MTPKQAVKQLHGCEIGNEGSEKLFAEMKASDLVAAFGASDDLLELRGAINDETGAYDGTTVYLDRDGLIARRCDDEDCPYDKQRIAEAKKSASRIEAVWCPRDVSGEVYASWLIKSDIPHETFNVMEGDELFCRGIVFKLGNAKGSDH